MGKLLEAMRAGGAPVLRDERGFSTAELLGNAALAILALVAIWGILQALGIDVINWIRGMIMGG